MAEEKQLKLLKAIFSNILKHPNEHKYRDLNFNRIAKKLNNSSTYLQWLYNAGFEISDNNKRLILHPSKIHQLRIIYNSLLLITNDSNTNYQCQSMTKIETKKPITYQHRTHHSSYFDVFSSYRCKLDHCLCLKTIGDILNRYKEFIERHQSNEQNQSNENNICSIHGIYEEINDKYNNVELLNDFNHLLYYHSDKFEDIYNALLSAMYDDGATCNISDCLLMTRNRRNRSEITRNTKILHRLYFDNDEITEQQLIDRIHCHFLHTFDIEYKLTAKQKQTIESKVGDGNAYNMDEAKDIDHDETKSCKITNNKFISDIKPYSFGIRFFYWDSYKDNDNTYDLLLGVQNPDEANANYTLGECYVINRYNNFKQELLQNEICYISYCQWLQLEENADIHIQTQLATNIRYIHNRAFLYDVRRQESIGKQHLIAIMVQCNYDFLQRKFTETFRKQSSEETFDSLKQRHSHYHFLARYLRECVECFGMHWTQNVPLYHGVDQHFTFESLDACIKGPFSATTDYGVAVNFCGREGMILYLELNACAAEGMKHRELRESGFECRYFSDFPNEKEIFFIGGSTEFIIRNIIELPLGANYKEYIKGLNVINRNMTTGGIRWKEITVNLLDSSFKWIYNEYGMKAQQAFANHGVADEFGYFRDCWEKQERNSQQMAFRLLAAEVWRYRPDHSDAHRFESCPDYFRKLFHSHCLNVKLVQLDFVSNKLFKRYFYNSEINWVDFDMVKMIFPNCRRMICPTPLSMIVAFESILSFIQFIANSNCKLQEIMILMDINDDIEKYVFDYKNKFASLSWKMHLRVSKHHERDMIISKFKSTLDATEKQYAEGMIKEVQGFGRIAYSQHKCLIMAKAKVKMTAYDCWFGDNLDDMMNDWLGKSNLDSGFHNCNIRENS